MTDSASVCAWLLSGSAAATPAVPAIKISAFSKDAPAEIKGSPSENAGSCSINVANNALLNGAEIAVNRTDGLSVDGWALGEKSVAVPQVVALQLIKGEERYYALLNRHGGRDDLIKAYGKPEFTNDGYTRPH